MNNNATLRDENILSLFSLNNLIVPEIQREYVWGLNERVVTKFLNDIIAQSELCDSCHHAHIKNGLNVGFLYSYKPPYVILENERYLDEYLIDGQQRITTVFLLLLSRAVKESCVPEFCAITRTDDLGHCRCFSYKVRDLTQQFLDDLMRYVILHKDNKNCIKDILGNDKPSWFLSDYKEDPTVDTMLKTLGIIDDVFENYADYQFFEFILQAVHFWHFKTEVTSQGEALYITMNSRGEQLSQNELQKASMLPKDYAGLKTWGAKWEEWQTIFWRNRGGNSDADEGFNSYLSCITSMEKVLLNTDTVPLERIELYIKALTFISSEELRARVTTLYPNYHSWFDDCINIIWRYINDTSDWTLPSPSDRGAYANASPIRNKLMMLWPWMYYLQKNGGTPENTDLLIRIMRLYYSRVFAYRRSASTIGKVIETLISNTHDSLLIISNYSEDESSDDEEGSAKGKLFSAEETVLSGIINSIATASLELVTKTEEAIWETQDISYFKDGRDVGGDTFYSFIEAKIVEQNNLIDSLAKLRSNLSSLELDGSNSSQQNLVKNILLFYKDSDGQAFWSKQTPWYYFNYDCKTWKRIVRSQQFIAFYREYFQAGFTGTLLDFLRSKRVAFFKDNCCFDYLSNSWSDRKLAIVYSVCCEQGLWDKDHFNVAFWNDSDEVTRLFKVQKSVWRGKVYYDKYSQVILREDWRDYLQKEYASEGIQFVFKNYDTQSQTVSANTEIENA